MSSFQQNLFTSNRIKRFANLCYIDVLTFGTFVAGVLPGPIRNWLMCHLFSRSGPGVTFDRQVYVKFPWLVHIGSGTSVNRGVEFYPDFANGHSIVIGTDCYIAPHVRFHASGHDLENMVNHVGAPIRVADDVWLGAGCVILPGVTVGTGSVVGAGAIVTKDVPPGVIVGGNPAAVIRER